MQLLFEYGSREKDLLNQKDTGIPHITLLDLKLEENHNQLAVQLVMRKYKKLFRWLFKKYTSKGYRAAGVKSTFGGFKKKAKNISLSDLWTLRKDFGLKKFVSKEELNALVRQVNTELVDNKAEVRFLSYKAFKHLFI